MERKFGIRAVGEVTLLAYHSKHSHHATVISITVASHHYHYGHVVPVRRSHHCFPFTTRTIVAVVWAQVPCYVFAAVVVTCVIVTVVVAVVGTVIESKTTIDVICDDVMDSYQAVCKDKIVLIW